MSTEQDRNRLALRVTEARRARFGTVEAAIRAAQINRATWERVEGGKRVRDDKLGAIEKALGWRPGDAWIIMAGGEPGDATVEPVGDDAAEVARLRLTISRSVALSDRDKALLLAQLDAMTSIPQDATGGEGHDRPAAM